jgi:hypothetical protein
MRAQMRANYAKHSKRILAYQKTYEKQNRKKINARKRAYRKKNRDKINAQKRARYHAKKKNNAS